MMRAPVIPKGWPRAIAPPCVLSLLFGDPAFGHDRDHLGGEGLVQLDRVDVVDRHPGPVEDLLDRADRRHAHVLGLVAEGGGGDDPGARGQAQLLGLGVAHQQHRGGAVVERAGVAGGDAAAAEGLGQFGELLQGRGGAGAVVLGDLGAVGSFTGTISRSKKPSSCDFTASSWERWANLSMSSRLTSYCLATLTAVMPMSM